MIHVLQDVYLLDYCTWKQANPNIDMTNVNVTMR
jgi:hypothetical protein